MSLFFGQRFVAKARRDTPDRHAMVAGLLCNALLDWLLLFGHWAARLGAPAAHRDQHFGAAERADDAGIRFAPRCGELRTPAAAGDASDARVRGIPAAGRDRCGECGGAGCSSACLVMARFGEIAVSGLPGGHQFRVAGFHDTARDRAGDDSAVDWRPARAIMPPTRTAAASA